MSTRDANLNDLQRQSLDLVAMFLGSVGYVWLMALIWPETGDLAPFGAWIGVLALAVGATTSLALSGQRPKAAGYLLIGASLVCALGTLLAYREPDLIYLSLVPVVVAAILGRPREALAVAALGIGLGLTIGLSVLGLPFSSRSVWLPAILFGVVAAIHALGMHSMRASLAWMWHGFEQAERNERLAAERQAELRRVLKALDETTYRLERANTELAQSRNRAEEARRLKQHFAQTISHELRTPLNLVVGFTDLMTQSPEYYGETLAPAYQRDLAIVARNARHLQDLVNDVLDLARIEAAEMTIVPEETDVAILVREAIATAESSVYARGLALVSEIAPDLPKLRVDPTRIRQVLFNLLNNAARFTERGRITVKVVGAGQDVLFSVADTGIGIAAEDLGRIFEEFQQADGTRRRRHGGAGLGLAISRRFVQMHGGRIWAESQIGKGSTFYFTLPTIDKGEVAGTGDHGPQASVTRVEPEQAPVLLVITHNPAGAGLISRYLPGCRTIVLPELSQARATAERLLPQGILIDVLHEPMDEDGLQALADEWALPRTAFIACPLPGEGVLQRSLSVAGYLIKPVTREQLWDTLRPLGEEIDRILVVDDDRDFARLVTRMLDHPVRRYQVHTADSGRRALDVLRTQSIDLILLDMVLPDMEGAQVIHAVRARPEWAEIPIVVVSGQDETMLKAMTTGPLLLARSNGLTPAELLRWLQSWLRLEH